VRHGRAVARLEPAGAIDGKGLRELLASLDVDED
jgi:hypothetical protein